MSEDYLDALVGEICANAIRWSNGDLAGKDFIEQTRGIVLAVMRISRSSCQTASPETDEEVLRRG